MGCGPRGPQGRERLAPVGDPQRASRRGARSDARSRGVGAIARGGGRTGWIEGGLWALTAASLSPLVAYAGRPVVPFAALYTVAAGIALGLGLAGRRLHRAMLSEAIDHRSSASQALLAAAMVLCVLVLVLLAAVVALLMLFRGSGPKLPI